MLHLLISVQMLQVQRPHSNLRHLEWIKHVHGDSVSSLIGQVPTDSAAHAFVCLPDINRLAVIIIKGIYAPFVSADFSPVFIQAIKESTDFLADGCDIRWQPDRMAFTAGRLFGS